MQWRTKHEEGKVLRNKLHFESRCGQSSGVANRSSPFTPFPNFLAPRLSPHAIACLRITALALSLCALVTPLIRRRHSSHTHNAATSLLISGHSPLSSWGCVPSVRTLSCPLWLSSRVNNNNNISFIDIVAQELVSVARRERRGQLDVFASGRVNKRWSIQSISSFLHTP